MNDNLENKINSPNKFKSAGERKIAEILDKYGISFKYESPVIIIDNDSKHRIWYPDFYLPQFGIYLEFYGFNGNPDYDSGVVKKNSVYAANGVPVISIYGGSGNGDMEHSLTSQVYHCLERRLDRWTKKMTSTYGPDSPGGYRP